MQYNIIFEIELLAQPPVIGFTKFLDISVRINKVHILLGSGDPVFEVKMDPVNKLLLTGTIPVNNELLTGTVPVNKQ